MSDIQSADNIPTYYQYSYYYPWQQLLWQQLYNNRAIEQFPHALLFSGVSGIGKKQFAFYLARALLCQSPRENPQTGQLEPCRQNETQILCRSCQLFSVASHPDCYHITPPSGKKIIPVDAIRELIQWSVLSSQLGGKKVIIIEPAEAMNINAANSLLKTLEEPVADTIIILLSSKKQALPATIRSRCRPIDIQLPEKQDGINWLIQQNVPQSELMLSLACGAPLLALQLSQGKQQEVRHFIIGQILSIVKDAADPVAVAELLFKQSQTKAASGKKTAQKKLAIHAYDVIYWFDSLLADLVRLAQNCDKETIINIDYYEHLQPLANKLYLIKMLQLSDSINKAYNELQGQINVNLLFEQLLIDWHDCY